MSPSLDSLVLERQQRLDGLLRGYESVLVAYSGGVDSAYLAARAHHVLGARAVAVTADSESLADSERQNAADVAARLGFAHRFVPSNELRNPLYVRNAPDRCFHCKTELFGLLRPIAHALGLREIAYGLIVDDLSDFRPGHRAAAAAGVKSPLADAGLTKADVRALSRAVGLPTWDRPASPCLSSRVAYGIAVTPVVLAQVERAEAALHRLGFRELRVRHLGEEARVEIAPHEMQHLHEPGIRERIERDLSEAGYRRVFVDPHGYRRGRLNEALERGGPGETGLSLVVSH